MGARAGSFLLLLRGAEASRSSSSSEESADHPQTAHKEPQPVPGRDQQEARKKKLGAFRSLPVFKASFLRPGGREKPVATGGAHKAQVATDERRPSLPYESDDDGDDSYAEDYNHDSGRVNSRSRRRKARMPTANAKRKEVRKGVRREAEESGSGERCAPSARGKELPEERDESQSSTSNESDEEETTEECVVVNSSDETDDEDSDDDSDADGSSDDEEERRASRRPSEAEVKSKRERARERERLKVKEEKRRQKVEKRKLKKVEKQKKREGLEEMQRQIQKLRDEKELKRQEEKDLKELRRIDKLLAREREREEKKVLKLQQKEQRQREKLLKQKQIRELILARLGRPAEDQATPTNIDSRSVPREMEVVSSVRSSVTSEREEQTTLATESREASTLLPMKDSMALLDEVAAEQDLESGRQVDDADLEEMRIEPPKGEDEEAEPRGYPSIVGLPSLTTRGTGLHQEQPEEVRITVIERRPSIPPRQIEPAEEETEEAEDEDEDDGRGRRVANNRRRVTDIPALRSTDKPSAAKRSPRAKASHASSAQLIRGLIGFDELEDALFELNRQVEELRTLTK